jgi:hypothetical protein
MRQLIHAEHNSSQSIRHIPKLSVKSSFSRLGHKLFAQLEGQTLRCRRLTLHQWAVASWRNKGIEIKTPPSSSGRGRGSRHTRSTSTPRELCWRGSNIDEVGKIEPCSRSVECTIEQRNVYAWSVHYRRGEMCILRWWCRWWLLRDLGQTSVTG